MRRKIKNNFEDSLDMNMQTYGYYLQRLIELSISMFEWENLPDTVNERFLELTLFKDGHAIFFNDAELDGYLALQSTNYGKFNVYRIPTQRRAFAINGYQKNLTDKDSVIIWNNYLHTNTYPVAKMYARRLYNLDRIIDVNANAQKTPVLIQCSESQKLTMENLYLDWDGNKPAIYGDKSLDPNGLKVLRTDAPFVSDKIYTLKTQIWNEALTYLGISNSNFVKKERLVSDEVIRNQGGTVASRYSRLEARRKACNEINKMFGTNIWCNYRQDYHQLSDDELVEDSEGKPTEGGDNNE